MTGRVLIIAGSDSGGGAGIQADIKTVTALGGYAMTAITAITVQDTVRVHDVHPLPAPLIEAQARVVLDDIGADAIKIGMIGSVDVAEVVFNLLTDYPDIPVVLDPVLVATSGDALGDSAVAALIREKLMPRCALLTPNLPEAAALSGLPVATKAEQLQAATALYEAGPKAVLVKGGHRTTEGHENLIEDILCSDDGYTLFQNERLDTTSTHGTGCTLASAIATGLAQGLHMGETIARARDYLQEAIRTAPGLGKGRGPLNHGHTLKT